MRSSRVVALAILAAAIVSGVGPARAAKDIMGGGYLVTSFPMGDWGKTAGFGLGLDGSTIVRPDTEGRFAIRTNMGFLYNFSRTADVPAQNVGTNEALSLETKNTSIFFGIGPEIGKMTRNASPFLFGTVGAMTYWTQSVLTGTAAGAPYEAEHGDSRIAFVWSAGVGIRRKVAPGAMGEISIEYRSGPSHKYVVPGDVTSPPVVADRSARNTDQLIVRFGTVLSAFVDPE